MIHVVLIPNLLECQCRRVSLLFRVNRCCAHNRSVYLSKYFYNKEQSINLSQVQWEGVKGGSSQVQDDYLRKVLRSPACVMATSVLVTEVPMLVPMMMGTASWTVRTARAHKHGFIHPASALIFTPPTLQICVYGEGYSRPEETMLTTMEEEVDELWTNRVTRTPMTRPARGLDKTELSWKISPAALPGYSEHWRFQPLWCVVAVCINNCLLTPCLVNNYSVMLTTI